jgi:hypothetical protein
MYKVSHYYYTNDSQQRQKKYTTLLNFPPHQINNVRNHVKLGVSPRILYCVVDTGYGIGGSLGDCRPALPKGRKCQMVKTQTESQ